MMMQRLQPTQIVNSVLDLEYQRLLESGKRVLIFDLDNTLCKRRARTLDPHLSDYLKKIQEMGFKIGILSNRRRNASDPIVHNLRALVPVVCSAGKPRRRGFAHLLETLKASPDEAAMIGDKWWTDILGANRLGLHSIRVRGYPSFFS